MPLEKVSSYLSHLSSLTWFVSTLESWKARDMRQISVYQSCTKGPTANQSPTKVPAYIFIK